MFGVRSGGYWGDVVSRFNTPLAKYGGDCEVDGLMWNGGGEVGLFMKVTLGLRS